MCYPYVLFTNFVMILCMWTVKLVHLIRQLVDTDHSANLFFFLRAVVLQSTAAEQNARTSPPPQPSAPNNSTGGIYFVLVTYLVFLFGMIACQPVNQMLAVQSQLVST